MKNTITKIIAVGLFIFIYVNSYAQEQPNPTHPQPNQPNQPNQPAKPMQQQSPKDEFVQKLNGFQPQLNDLLAKAKENATSNPDLTKETSKLNDMVVAFKTQLDKFDTSPRDQQSGLASSLSSDWDAIQAQYNKSTALLSKAPQNDMPEKQKPNNQPPPKK